MVDILNTLHEDAGKVVVSSESEHMDLDMVMVRRLVDIVRMGYYQVEDPLVHTLAAQVDILFVVVEVVRCVEVDILDLGSYSMDLAAEMVMDGLLSLLM